MFEAAPQLQPYRLKVVLVENRRVAGKVKQDIIAVLGSIDATWLADFWDGLDDADEIRRDDWAELALLARRIFWEKAGPRLDQLANRLGEEAKRIRAAVEARIPPLTVQEHKRLEFALTLAHLERVESDLSEAREFMAIHEEIGAEVRPKIEALEQAAVAVAREVSRLTGLD